MRDKISILKASLEGGSHFDHKLKEMFKEDNFYLWSFANEESGNN